MEKRLDKFLEFYLYHFRRMNHIERFSTTPKIGRSNSVAEHTLSVIYISNFLVEYLGLTEKINYKKMINEAMNHDVVEVFTGDIIKTFKTYAGKSFNNYLKDIENGLMQKVYKNFELEIENVSKESIEFFLVRLADIIEAWLFAIEQLHMNNSYFAPHNKNIKLSLCDYINNSTLGKDRINLLRFLIGRIEHIFTIPGNSSMFILELIND